MKNSITVHSVTEKVPPQAIQDCFGVKERSIRLARERGVFPASWYKGMKELCRKHGADFSDELFNWKSSDCRKQSGSPIKGGNAKADNQPQPSESAGAS